MGVWRKWIFPTVRIVLVAVIAVALAKLAFFPDREATAPDALVPTGTVTEPEVPVVRGSIANDLVLTGTVNADPAVPVKAVATGTVDEVFVAVGAQVSAGQVLYDVKVPDEVEPVEPVAQPGPDGMPVVTVPRATFHFEKVLAPAAGVLSALDVIVGQPVATGDVTGQVAPPSFNVTASLSPAQQYRLTSAPTEALVTIAGGPAPFACGGLSISTPVSGAGGAGGGGVTTGVGDAGAAPAGGGAGTTVRCVVPGDVRVFAGLSAQVTISAGSAADVLVVPITAVEGGAESGVVWKVADGERVEQPVRLGLTDGSQVEVVEGLAEGDLVLQFVPGAPAQGPGEGCVTMPDGSMTCGTIGR
ncbi:hypothetical protein GE115_17400 [Agromyces sp. CFH 90414]|uniref:Multidrug resistance protein MdtA-like C-terminal permuted SH3 domain-containing protein n=1 Tax=Agromyces agglutinans TaxID=2662258 RepID=A0A6I2FCV8_9MICO|nr:efflux RND transporter periplasmic adaptor subunit [Agromyces agglutinans]MRG61637.1 hypothetical protein [Agromyces agglutinans]